MVPWPSLIVVVTSAVFELNDFDPILLESAQPQNKFFFVFINTNRKLTCFQCVGRPKSGGDWP